MRMIGPVPSCSGLATRPTPVGVRGPPSAGMQPMKGMELDVCPGSPTDVARKTVSLRVVIPGLTGLPIRPGNLTGTHGFATRASRPPTKPSGQPSSHTAVQTRAGGTGAGTTTHGPATGLQIVNPSQTRGGAGDADDGGQRREHEQTPHGQERAMGERPHGTLRSQINESTAPASKKPSAPSPNANESSSFFGVLPIRDLSCARTGFRSAVRGPT